MRRTACCLLGVAVTCAFLGLGCGGESIPAGAPTEGPAALDASQIEKMKGATGVPKKKQ